MLRERAFSGRLAFCSNFYDSPVMFDWSQYPTVEHAYQAAKTLNKAAREEIRLASTPGKAKRLGQQVDIRPDWEDVKVEIMRDLVWRKFQIPELAYMLLDTGDTILEERNYWGDTFWGICDGVGQNWLGKLLMETRERLQTDD